MSNKTAALLLFGILASTSLTAVPEASSASRVSLILRQLGNDMTYGADEYFGDSRDLLYADQVTPAVKAVPVAAVATPATTQHSDRSRSDKDDTSTQQTVSATPVSAPAHHPRVPGNSGQQQQNPQPQPQPQPPPVPEPEPPPPPPCPS